MSGSKSKTGPLMRKRVNIYFRTHGLLPGGIIFVSEASIFA